MLAGFELALFLWTPLIKDHASLPAITHAGQRTTCSLRIRQQIVYSLEWLRVLNASAMYLTRDLTYHPPMKIATFYYHHAAHLPDRPQSRKNRMRQDKRSWVRRARFGLSSPPGLTQWLLKCTNSPIHNN